MTRGDNVSHAQHCRCSPTHAPMRQPFCRRQSGSKSLLKDRPNRSTVHDNNRQRSLVCLASLRACAIVTIACVRFVADNDGTRMPAAKQFGRKTLQRAYCNMWIVACACIRNSGLICFRSLRRTYAQCSLYNLYACIVRFSDCSRLYNIALKSIYSGFISDGAHSTNVAAKGGECSNLTILFAVWWLHEDDDDVDTIETWALSSELLGAVYRGAFESFARSPNLRLTKRGETLNCIQFDNHWEVFLFSCI